MSFTTLAICLSLALFIGLLIFMEIGRRWGHRFQAADEGKSRAGLGAVEAAVFGLLGLLLALSFSGAATRFNDRRDLVAEDANAIGTAWLRVDLLPAEGQESVRPAFRAYFQARMELNAVLGDKENGWAKLEEVNQLEQTLWKMAVAACLEDQGGDSGKLLLPALNTMIDALGVRATQALKHPPPFMFGFLLVVAWAASLLAGFAMSGGRIRSQLHLYGFAMVLAVSFYVVLDLEYPRMGLIRVNDADWVFEGLSKQILQ